MLNSDVYENAGFCRFYDWVYDGFEGDIPFYLGLAERYGPPVLEVACGTGRVTLPLARAGFEVVGIDLSEPMLAIARSKCECEPEEVRNAVSLIQTDMRHFRLGRTFCCVFVPNASLFHLHDAVALRQCFACLFEHTRPGGVLAVDLVAPKRMANQEVGDLHLVGEGMNPFTGLMTKEYNRKLAIDRDRQIVRVEHVYVEDAGTRDRRYAFTQDYRWIEEKEGANWFSEAGYVGMKTFGDYEGSPYSLDSHRLILVGERPDRDGIAPCYTRFPRVATR